jgi:hypothetical protein
MYQNDIILGLGTVKQIEKSEKTTLILQTLLMRFGKRNVL